MNILIACYYFPPVGMGGVQRPAKFAKYLARMGHQVTVLAAEPTDDEITDDTLLADIPDNVRVVRVKARDPRNLIPKMPGTMNSNGGSLLRDGKFIQRAAAWLRLPDAQIGFIPGALNAARKIYADNPPDVLLTSSPPPSINILGARLQKLWQIPWLADFRDPWFMATDQRLPTPLHRAIHLRVLGETLKRADRVVVVSPGIIDDFNKWGFDRSDIKVITNGYDEDDFKQQEEISDVLISKRFRFHLYGTISPFAPPEPFFHVLSTWRKNNPEQADKIEVSHRGAVRDVDLKQMIDKYDLPQRFVSLGYAPHWYAVRELAEAHALVLSVADRPGLRSNIPGRVYECLRSRRPIIAFVSAASAVADILREFDGVQIIDPGDEKSAIQAIDNLFRHWQTNPQPQLYPRETVTKYSRKHLTEQIVNTFHSIKR